ncbi:isotrichodermin C-15 hydroxylase protein [Rutstroemia sp. NJR-2017a BBW]|nr:isotrichodermin C-15 hydroxylase protein [Rutstroemia sp. NJR-2017a BBW]
MVNTSQEPLLKKFDLDRIIFPQMTKASTSLSDYARFYTMQRIQKYRNTSQLEEKVDNHDVDIMYHLLNARDEETNSVYSDHELLGEAVLLMMAGSDTTATALTSTLFQLSHNPAQLQNLRTELDTHFQSSNDISVAVAENCKYLRACIDEAMRLCPPAPTNIPRLVGAGGITVLNTHYPEGVCIGVPNFTLFRNAAYFAEPHAYIPERWIVDSDTHDEESVKRAHSAFKPFSIGPRHCIAQRLAIKEISYVVAKLVYQFEFEVVGRCGTLEEDVLPDSKGTGPDDDVLAEST